MPACLNMLEKQASADQSIKNNGEQVSVTKMSGGQPVTLLSEGTSGRYRVQLDARRNR